MLFKLSNQLEDDENQNCNRIFSSINKCSITKIRFTLISETQNCYHFLNTDPKMAIINNLYHVIPETFLYTLM